MSQQLDFITYSGLDCSTIKIIDNTVINPSFPITNAILEITPPGYNCPVVINVSVGFNLTLNTNSLKILSTPVGTVVALPDGAYRIHYSVNPNVKSFIEKIHFQDCKIRTKYRNKMNDLFKIRCSTPRKDFDMFLEKLQWIRDLIDVSGYKAVDCGDLIGSAEIYNEANILIDELNFTSRC